jgi:hypothetical protein
VISDEKKVQGRKAGLRDNRSEGGPNCTATFAKSEIRKTKLENRGEFRISSFEFRSLVTCHVPNIGTATERTALASSLNKKRMTRATLSVATHWEKSALGMARRFASVSMVPGRMQCA